MGYGAAALGPTSHEKNKNTVQRDERTTAEKHCQGLACDLSRCASKNLYNQMKCNGIKKEYHDCIQGFKKSLDGGAQHKEEIS
mmetsp:Transcript_503/g.593  ORF Transcript_503/g.593 Transcript_503/m.593 type:complete len:83 (+) Transcript_503:72-320(+)